jgi:hypothetical protein
LDVWRKETFCNGEELFENGVGGGVENADDWRAFELSNHRSVRETTV